MNTRHLARHLAAAALAIGLAAPAAAQQAGQDAGRRGWEIGAYLGRDLMPDENYLAVSVAHRYGNGWKGVFEYANGMGGDSRRHDVAVKAMYRLFATGRLGFELGLGVAHVSDVNERGWGMLLSAGAQYELTGPWAARLEFTRVLGASGIGNYRASNAQAGIVYRF
jgi:opacity protein-like surface antigen